MKTTTHAAPTRSTRWSTQVALALVLAGFFAMSSLAGVVASSVQDTYMETCTEVGGQPFQMLGPDGEVVSTHCALSEDEVHTLSRVSGPDAGPTPTKPTDNLSPGSVGVKDLAPVAEPVTKPAFPIDQVVAPTKG